MRNGMNERAPVAETPPPGCGCGGEGGGHGRGLGYTPGPDELPLAERERLSREARERHERESPIRDSGLPTRSDWTNRAGLSYITPATNQGSCGACTAFAVVNVINGMMRIGLQIPTSDGGSAVLKDLSPGHLFYCGAGGQCDRGSDLVGPLSYAFEWGVVPWDDYPYVGWQIGCRISFEAYWQTRATKTTGYQLVSLAEDGIEAMKRWIDERGPMVAAMTVYEDFRSHYTGDVYHWDRKSLPANGAGEQSGHAVCIVGYDDERKAWHAKNSWGTSWGDHGFFYIGYGECGIDALMWGIKGVSAVHRYPKAAGKPSLCVFRDQLHYCYRDEHGALYDVIWSGGHWDAVQLTGTGGLTAGPLADCDPVAVSYGVSNGDQLHCLYRDKERNIWDIVYGEQGWQQVQLTLRNGISRGGVPVRGGLVATLFGRQLRVAYSPPFVFGTGLASAAYTGDEWTNSMEGFGVASELSAAVLGNQLHYCYAGNKGYVEDACLQDGRWTHVVLTGPQGKTPSVPSCQGNPAVLEWEGQLHYYLRDAAGSIWTVMNSGSEWTGLRLTGPGGTLQGAPAAAGDPVVLNYFRQRHCCYRDVHGHLQDIIFANGRWQIQDVTVLAKAALAAGDPTLIQYKGAGFDQMHYTFRDAGGVLRDIVWTDSARGWVYQTV